MIYTLDEELIEKSGLTLQEVLFLLLIKEDGTYIKAMNSLYRKNAISGGGEKMYISLDSFDKIEYLLTKKNKTKNNKFSHESLIVKMMEIFPNSIQVSSGKNFRGNRNDNMERMQKFFLFYDKYKDSDILNATERYVKSFNGDYSYMRRLPYFIWRAEIKEGVLMRNSDLATYLENKDIDDNKDNTDDNMITL